MNKKYIYLKSARYIYIYIYIYTVSVSGETFIHLYFLHFEQNAGGSFNKTFSYFFQTFHPCQLIEIVEFEYRVQLHKICYLTRFQILQKRFWFRYDLLQKEAKAVLYILMKTFHRYQTRLRWQMHIKFSRRPSCVSSNFRTS